MPEYINKQQILEKAKQHQNNPFAASLIIAEIEKADDDLVRCKDCKYRRETLHRSYCLSAFGLKQITDLNSSCSYGERRDNNG